MRGTIETRSDHGPLASCAAWPAPMRALADVSAEAARVEREATRAAAVVAALVAVPAAIAAGAVLVLFALNLAVLLAPVIAIALTWTAWRANRHAPPPPPG